MFSIIKGPMDLLAELKRRRLVVPASRVGREVRTVPSGLFELDRIAGGGLPAGAITEVVAPSCGGATVLYAALAGATSRGETAAVVDPQDGFDVASAHAAGVVLERLLWVRPQGPFHNALRALERILSSGGFAMAVLDTGVGPGKVPGIPAAWMRVLRLARASGAVVLVISTAPRVGTFASLAVEVRRRRAHWRGRVPKERWLEGIELSFDLRRKK
jgi:hypothetical protein